MRSSSFPSCCWTAVLPLGAFGSAQYPRGNPLTPSILRNKLTSFCGLVVKQWASSGERYWGAGTKRRNNREKFQNMSKFLQNSSLFREFSRKIREILAISGEISPFFGIFFTTVPKNHVPLEYRSHFGSKVHIEISSWLSFLQKFLRTVNKFQWNSGKNSSKKTACRFQFFNSLRWISGQKLVKKMHLIIFFDSASFLLFFSLTPALLGLICVSWQFQM